MISLAIFGGLIDITQTWNFIFLLPTKVRLNLKDIYSF